MLPLRIYVDREKGKVLFAEADNDFFDTLFSFLTLPMGTIIRILRKHTGLQSRAMGGLKNLYDSVGNLPAKHLSSEECREMLLKPKNAAESQCLGLKLNVDDSGPTAFFICEDWECSRRNKGYLSIYKTMKCSCGKFLSREISIRSGANIAREGEVFVNERSSFFVTDDLHVIPNPQTTVFDLFKNLGYSDLKVVDEMYINVGLKEMLNLLDCSLQSKSPMTDTFLKKRLNISSIVKSVLCNSTRNEMGGTTENCVTIEIVVQKSSDKVLFARALENFVDFLFSFLTIPLGGFASIFSGEVAFGSIGNLYTSVSMLNKGKYNDTKSKELKEMLVNPQLATMHLCNNQIFCLSEAKTPQYYCLSKIISNSQYTGYLTQQRFTGPVCCKPLIQKNPKFEGKYTRPARFIVTDELVVKPLSSFSVVSLIQKSNILLSDVEEQVISIGLEEARRILESAFESTSVLTSAFLNIIKQEKP